MPLPFSTHNDDPRASTAVGYHWTGMRPSGCATPDETEVVPVTSKTATALLSASAT